MTQPPYVPPRDDDNTRSSTGWPASAGVPAGDQDSDAFESQFPESGTAGYSEGSGYSSASAYSQGTSTVGEGAYASGSQDYSSGSQSTTEVAKGQAAEVKDTAVQAGQ